MSSGTTSRGGVGLDLLDGSLCFRSLGGRARGWRRGDKSGIREAVASCCRKTKEVKSRNENVCSCARPPLVSVSYVV